MEPHRYFVLHKPFNMVSQFVSPDAVNLLGQIDFDFPPGTHAIGRLDNHSEGLLLLTTDKRVTRLLFSAAVPHRRDYLVRVRNEMAPGDLERLRAGVMIRVGLTEEWLAKPVAVEEVGKPDWLPDRLGEYSDRIPHAWLKITLTEGRFHQVRKMVMAIRHPCQRLIRTSIEDLHLGDLPSGAVREYSGEEFFRLLKIQP